MKLSIILPIYNEEENIEKCFFELKSLLTRLNFDYEIIAVNDGSIDKSGSILKRLAQSEQQLKIIDFRRNYGQTAALFAGFNNSTGDILIPMDADLQNDPADISRLLEKINNGYDLVSGWRKDRKDKLIRKIPSWVANWLISKVTGVKLHDYGCTLKAYRRDIIQDIKFYGEMHRFMPAYAALQGAKIIEMPVNHRPRVAGVSKYGFSRIFKVALDLITVKFLMSYLSKPMHFFGKVGIYSLLASFFAGLGALYLRFFQGISFISTPLPLLVVFLAFVGVQFILMGLLAEILIRIYYDSKGRGSYTIKDKINF